MGFSISIRISNPLPSEKRWKEVTVRTVISWGRGEVTYPFSKFAAAILEQRPPRPSRHQPAPGADASSRSATATLPNFQFPADDCMLLLALIIARHRLRSPPPLETPDSHRFFKPSTLQPFNLQPSNHPPNLLPARTNHSPSPTTTILLSCARPTFAEPSGIPSINQSSRDTILAGSRPHLFRIRSAPELGAGTTLALDWHG